MKKSYLFYCILIGIAAIFFCCSEDEPDMPNADFVIEKDSIIDGKKLRVAVDEVIMGETVYFVSKGDAMFNCVWPGDSAKVGSKTTYRDYDTRQELVIIGPKSRNDSTIVIKSAPYQGINVDGTEISHIFTSKGNLTVTWVATNCNSVKCVTSIKQKPILVE